MPRDVFGRQRLFKPPDSRAAESRRGETARQLEDLCATAEEVRADESVNAADLLGRKDVEFHSNVAIAAGNRVVVEVLQQTLVPMSRYTLYKLHGAADQAWAEHRAVDAAIAAGDPHAAETAMRAHLSIGLTRALHAVN
ncbi:MAG TPA: FCD domain-containing protein [Microbacterium sp.]|nr:FCD domain-containing protein [Microbacterium sp.]